MMEDQANNFFSVPADPQAVAMVSIAISLKRIADALAMTPGPENIHDFLNDIRFNTQARAR